MPYGMDTTGGTTAGTTGAGGQYGGASYLDWLKFAAQLYDSQKKGSFKNEPMSPQQAELYGWSRNQVANLPNANAAAYPIALMGAASSPTLDMDKLRRGEAGAYGAPERMDVPTLMGILQGQRTAAANPVGNPAGTQPGLASAPAAKPKKLTKKKKINTVAKGILRGLVGGAGAGPVGGIAGAVMGGLQARKQNNATEAQYKAENAAAAAPPMTGAPGVNPTDAILDWYWSTHGGKPGGV